MKQWTNEQTRASVAHISEEDRKASTPTKGVTFATGDDNHNDNDNGAATPPRASTPTPEDDLENPEQLDTSTAGEVLTPPPTDDDATRPAMNDLGKSYSTVRSARKLNMDTGTTNSRECTAKVVSRLVEPMNPLERRRKELNFMNKKSQADISSKTIARDTQYRLRSKTVSHKNRKIKEMGEKYVFRILCAHIF